MVPPGLYLVGRCVCASLVGSARSRAPRIAALSFAGASAGINHSDLAECPGGLELQRSLVGDLTGTGTTRPVYRAHRLRQPARVVTAELGHLSLRFGLIYAPTR